LFGVDAGGTRTATTRQPEALLLQHVEGLLDDAVLQEEARRVTIRHAMVGIAALV